MDSCIRLSKTNDCKGPDSGLLIPGSISYFVMITFVPTETNA